MQRYQLLYIIFAVCALLLIVSPIWLRHFRFELMEWLWRSLTYWQRQPMRLKKRPQPSRPAYCSERELKLSDKLPELVGRFGHQAIHPAGETLNMAVNPITRLIETTDKLWQLVGQSSVEFVGRVNLDLRHRLVLAGIERRQFRLRRAEFAQVFPRRLQAPVIGKGWPVAPRQPVGLGRGFDGFIGVACVSFELR